MVSSEEGALAPSERLVYIYICTDPSPIYICTYIYTRRSEGAKAPSSLETIEIVKMIEMIEMIEIIYNDDDADDDDDDSLFRISYLLFLIA